MPPSRFVIRNHPGNLGDVELAPVQDRCAAYTPVPGGVGPMTIATLISQTVAAAEAAAGIASPQAQRA